MRSVLLLAGLLATGSVQGQSRLAVQGTAMDAAGRPLPLVSVSLTDGPQVVAFASTDAQGRYKLLVPAATAEVYTLTARALGFASQAQQVEAVQLRPAYDFTLLPEALMLREVLIRAPIVQRNDTTTFDLKQFTDSTSSEKLESVLKRLPGFEVQENGRLYFKGKQVSKVLLDGDDLFDDRYPLATRNLRASLIDKVQAIEDYQENALLKGLKRGDDVAVNLTVKPDKRRVLTGTAQATTNFGDRYQLRGDALSYLKNLKGMWIGDANNLLADNPVSAEVSTISGDNQRSLPTLMQPASTVDLTVPPPTGLPVNRFLDSRLGSGAASLAGRWSERVKSNAYVVASGLRTRFAQNTEEQYVRLPTEFAIREQLASHQRGQYVLGRHELTAQLSKRSELRVLTYAQRTSRTTNRDLATSLSDNPVREQWRSTPLLLAQRVEGTHRINDHQALQVRVQYTDQRLTQTSELPELATTGLPPAPRRYASQQNQLMRREFSAAAEWLWKYGNFGGTVQGDATLTRQGQRVTVSNTGLAPGSQDFALDHRAYHLGFNANRTLGQTELKGGLTGTIVNVGLGSQNTFQVWLGPKLTVRHQFSQTKQLLLTYRYDLEDQTLHYYYPGTLLTSYRTRFSGLDTTAFWGSQLLLANFSQQDLLSNRRLSLTALVTRRDNTVKNVLRVEPAAIQSQVGLANRPMYFADFSGTLDQLIVPLDLVLKARLGFGLLEQFNQVNGTEQSIRAVNRRLGLELNTVFSKPYTINLSSQYILSDSRQTAQPANLLRTHTLLLQERASAKFGAWRLRAYGQQSYVSGGGTRGQSYFLDVSTEYALNSKGLTMALECRNLLNEQQFVMQTVNNLSVALSRYDVLGRWLLLSFNCPF